MTDIDPIDEWLGTDVELLQPPAGAFERIHRRARRRKAMVAAGSAAGAAVMIAAAAVLPQIASGFLPGHGNVPEKVGQSGVPSQVTPQNHRSSASRHHTGPDFLSPPGGTASITTSGHSPAPGFQPTSVTFVGQSIGAVIGYTTRSCPAGSCTVVAGTTSYGQSWSAADAPHAGPPDGGSGVSQIRFLDQANGWAYGPELYSTHDGGKTWTKITGLPGRVIDLATVGTSAFSVVASCSGTGPGYAVGCTSFALYSSPYNSDNWQPVPGAAARQAPAPGGLQITSGYGYLLAGQVIYTGATSGGTWKAGQIRSSTVPACLRGGGHPASGESGLIAPGTSSQLYLLCQGDSGGQPALPVLYESPDGGANWQRAGQARFPGIATSLAVVPPGGQNGGAVVASIGSGLYYSAGGQGWHAASLSGQAPAGGFSFVGMTTNQKGVAVPASPSVGKIYITTDGGLSWHARSI